MMGRGGGPMAMMKGEKAKNFKGTMKRLMVSLKPYTVRIVIVFLFAILSTIFSIIGPKVMGNATTVLLDGVLATLRGTGDIDFGRIGTILLTVLALYVFSSLASFIMGWIMAKVSTDLA
jgi:ATP-binding cassette subfamily B protein